MKRRQLAVDAALLASLVALGCASVWVTLCALSAALVLTRGDRRRRP